MSNSYIIQKLIDGPRNVVMKVDVSLDGSGDYVNPQTIVNLSTLSSMGPTFGLHPKDISVIVLDWDIQQSLAVNLFWDGFGPASLWRMVGRSMEKAYSFGGLRNNADQPNGNITMTTASQSLAVPLVGSFTIRCVKRR